MTEQMLRYMYVPDHSITQPTAHVQKPLGKAQGPVRTASHKHMYTTATSVGPVKTIMPIAISLMSQPYSLCA